jgi:hypothetical protein
MNRKQSQNQMTMLSNWMELFYLQVVLPEQNSIFLLSTIKNSATLLFALNSTTSGNTLQATTSGVARSSLA